MRSSQEDMIQNLKDAGCDKDTIMVFVQNLQEEKIDEGLKILAVHRRSLLDALHKEQKQIDCLDYLVYTLTDKANPSKRR